MIQNHLFPFNNHYIHVRSSYVCSTVVINVPVMLFLVMFVLVMNVPVMLVLVMLVLVINVPVMLVLVMAIIYVWQF